MIFMPVNLFSTPEILVGLYLGAIHFAHGALAKKSAESQLYEDLLFHYNKVPRPVRNSSDVLTIDVGSSLIRIIDVDEKNQVLTTNLWLEMRWRDYKLAWVPEKYGGIKLLHIPSTEIWTPDFVLYNNAAGDPDITIFTDALVTHDGRVFWQPPGIYKSFCSIDVTWFPYDVQNCTMKFGAWSYTGFYVDLRQLPLEKVVEKNDTPDGSIYQYLEDGMDLSFFHKSAEWDLLELTSERHSVLYASCCGPEKYVDITYRFILRRKTLFFTCNLIIPCFLISFLTTFVFYLSDHKITFSISILVTLTVFFLVLIDIVPPTSLIVPMFGRYLITTMCLVALSTAVSVVTVNFRFRSGAAHRMSPWIKSLFLTCLPRLLLMKRPERGTKVKLEERPSYHRGHRVATTLLGGPCFAAANIGTTIISESGSEHPVTSSSEQSARGGNGDESGRQGSSDQSSTPPPTAGSKPASLVKKKQAKMTKQQRRLEDFSTHDWLERTYFPRYPDLVPIELGASALLTTTLANNQPQLGNSHYSHPGKIQATGSSSNSTPEFVNKGDAKATLNPIEYTNYGLLGASRATPNTIALGDADDARLDAAKLRTKQKINDVILRRLLKQVRFIAEYFRRNEEEAEISDDWTFVGMVLDRLFLVIFSVLNMLTFTIIIEAPSLYDKKVPLNVTAPWAPLGQANLFNMYN